MHLYHLASERLKWRLMRKRRASLRIGSKASQQFNDAGIHKLVTRLIGVLENLDKDGKAQDSPIGHQFIVALDHLNNAQAKIPLRKTQKLDAEETAALKLPPEYNKYPPEDKVWILDCNKRCLLHYGYVLKPLPPRGATENTEATQGLVLPITQGKITDQFNGQQDTFACGCETRPDFYRLLREFRVEDRDVKAFETIKKESSIQTLQFLGKVFEETGLQLVSHELFLQAIIESMLASGMVSDGLKTVEQMKAELIASQGIIMASVVDSNYWDNQRFHNRPMSVQED